MTSPSIRPEKIEAPAKMTEAQEASKRLRELSVEMLKADADMKLPWGMIDPDDGADVIDNLSAAIESLKTENDGLRAAIAWALGEKGDFPIRQERQGAYYWRTELRRRAFLTAQEESDNG